MEKCINLVDLEKCCKMTSWLQKSVLIQPRTSLGKSDEDEPSKAGRTAENSAGLCRASRIWPRTSTATSRPASSRLLRSLEITILHSKNDSLLSFILIPF